MNDLKEYYFRSIERFKVEHNDGKIIITDNVKKETIVFNYDHEGILKTIAYVRDNSN